MTLPGAGHPLTHLAWRTATLKRWTATQVVTRMYAVSSCRRQHLQEAHAEHTFLQLQHRPLQIRHTAAQRPLTRGLLLLRKEASPGESDQGGGSDRSGGHAMPSASRQRGDVRYP